MSLEDAIKQIKESMDENYDYLYMDKLIRQMKKVGKTPEEAIKIIMASGVSEELASNEVIKIYKEDND